MSERIEVKKPRQIQVMRRAGLVTSLCLDAMCAAVRPGITTASLDRLARRLLAEGGATSSFLGYGADWGYPPYPGVACISVNEVVVHGIPDERVLAAGDIVSIDFGAIVDGWHGDAARTVVVGETDEASRELIEVTRQAMWDGIAQIRVGARVGDVSHAVEASIGSHGRRYGIPREYTGHGIGSAMHQPPDVPNLGRARKGPRIVAGMCLCVEPMVTLGSSGVAELDDGWTVVTRDSSRAAHWENTVAVMPDGLWVLTEPDGGRVELEARGVPFSPLAPP